MVKDWYNRWFNGNRYPSQCTNRQLKFYAALATLKTLHMIIETAYLRYYNALAEEKLRLMR